MLSELFVFRDQETNKATIKQYTNENNITVQLIRIALDKSFIANEFFSVICTNMTDNTDRVKKMNVIVKLFNVNIYLNKQRKLRFMVLSVQIFPLICTTERIFPLLTIKTKAYVLHNNKKVNCSFVLCQVPIDWSILFWDSNPQRSTVASFCLGSCSNLILYISWAFPEPFWKNAFFTSSDDSICSTGIFREGTVVNTSQCQSENKKKDRKTSYGHVVFFYLIQGQVWATYTETIEKVTWFLTIGCLSNLYWKTESIKEKMALGGGWGDFPFI